jgi:hypothetical protein
MTYEVLITHAGYTDTAYALCGDEHCATVVLESIGVPSKLLAGLDSNDPGELDLGGDTTVEVGILGESDSCEWCATCGTFIRHGLKYEGEDVGCTHDQEGPDPEPRKGPHIDLEDAVPMKEYWGTIFNS